MTRSEARFVVVLETVTGGRHGAFGMIRGMKKRKRSKGSFWTGLSDSLIAEKRIRYISAELVDVTIEEFL